MVTDNPVMRDKRIASSAAAAWPGGISNAKERHDVGQPERGEGGVVQDGREGVRHRAADDADDGGAGVGLPADVCHRHGSPRDFASCSLVCCSA